MNRGLNTKFVLIVGLLGTLTACSPPPPTGEETQDAAQARSVTQAVEQIGMPAITRFAEKRALKQIYELRDKEVPTYTYIVDRNGATHKLCNSVGFGIPYSTQYTNPEYLPYRNSESNTLRAAVLPQADPNALYSPASADGTWVLCVDPKTSKAVPLYVEPRIIVSTFELR